MGRPTPDYHQALTTNPPNPRPVKTDRRHSPRPRLGVNPDCVRPRVGKGYRHLASLGASPLFHRTPPARASQTVGPGLQPRGPRFATWALRPVGLPGPHPPQTLTNNSHRRGADGGESSSVLRGEVPAAVRSVPVAAAAIQRSGRRGTPGGHQPPPNRRDCVRYGSSSLWISGASSNHLLACVCGPASWPADRQAPG